MSETRLQLETRQERERTELASLYTSMDFDEGYELGKRHGLELALNGLEQAALFARESQEDPS